MADIFDHPVGAVSQATSPIALQLFIHDQALDLRMSRVQSAATRSRLPLTTTQDNFNRTDRIDNDGGGGGGGDDDDKDDGDDGSDCSNDSTARCSKDLGLNPTQIEAR